MPRKALVTGATGLLGRQVLAAFQEDSNNWTVEGQGLTRAINVQWMKQADLTKDGDIEALLDDVKPDVVVHCAANRFPEVCNSNPSLARKINVTATSSLARATSSRNILLIYISTDYVFPGREGEAPYETTSQTSPPNIYGQTKLEGEHAVLEATKSTGLGVILRLPLLYGKAESSAESGVNVLVDAIWKAQNPDSKVDMDDWSQRYPTNTEDVARVCHDIAVKYLDACKDGDVVRSLPSVLQFSSEDKMTKYQMCEVLAEILGVPLRGLNRISQPSGGSGAQRPYDTHLSTKALKELGVSVHTMDFKAWWRRELGAIRH